MNCPERIKQQRNELLAGKKQDTPPTMDEARKAIDAIFKLYPELVPFFAECHRRVVTTRGQDPPNW